MSCAHCCSCYCVAADRGGTRTQFVRVSRAASHLQTIRLSRAASHPMLAINHACAFATGETRAACPSARPTSRACSHLFRAFSQISHTAAQQPDLDLPSRGNRGEANQRNISRGESLGTARHQFFRHGGPVGSWGDRLFVRRVEISVRFFLFLVTQKFANSSDAGNRGEPNFSSNVSAISYPDSS